MKGNSIRSAYHCEIELLTPVHIGSGDRYVEHFDFFYDAAQQHLFVFDRNRLLQQVAEAGEDTIVSFTGAVEDASLGDWLKSKPDGIHMKHILLHSVTCNNKPREISVQLRSGTGEPLLAGSSLKGALRTAVLTRLSDEENRSSVVRFIRSNLQRHDRLNLKFADRELCGNLLGPDAQKNLMRTLSVSDFCFAHGSCKLQNVILTRLTNNSNMGVKFGVMLEKIPENSRACGQVSFDDFLGKYGDTMGFRTRLSLPWLMDAIRRKTEKTIDTELDFFQGVSGPHIKNLKMFYEQLQGQIRQLDENEVILQLAWGSGWNGMTGELLEKEELTSQVRKNLNLAPSYSRFPFPKSRRIAVSDGRAVPMGWVKLSFVDKEATRQRQADRLKKDKEKQAVRLAKAIAFKEEKEQWEGLSETEKCVAIILGDAIARSQAPGMEGIRDVWPKLDSAEPEQQKRMARVFYQIWHEQPGFWRKKLCSPSQWRKVRKVVALLNIPHDDIQQFDPGEQEIIGQIDTCNEWGRFNDSDIKIANLPLSAALHLEEKFKIWGCNNKKAKRSKVQAWQQLQEHLTQLRRSSSSADVFPEVPECKNIV